MKPSEALKFYDDIVDGSAGYLNVDRDEMNVAWNVLYKAIEKQNAKKPIRKEQRDTQWQIDTWHECPVCQEEIYQTDYCPGCGQKIDWSDADED